MLPRKIGELLRLDGVDDGDNDGLFDVTVSSIDG